MSKFPKLNSEYFTGITKQIQSGINTIADLTREKNQLDKMIKSGNYAGQKLHEMAEERTSVGMRLSAERDNQMRTIKAMCAEFAEELRKEDDLNPKDIAKDDWALLTSGIDYMTTRDLEAMIDRNSNNRTMLQLILRCAKEHGRANELAISYVGNDTKIQNVNLIPELCKTFFRYDDGMEGSAGYVYNQVMGEGTNLANMFSPEND